jgi:hypothetical protein
VASETMSEMRLRAAPTMYSQNAMFTCCGGVTGPLAAGAGDDEAG